MFNRYGNHETTINVEAVVDISEFCTNLTSQTALKVIADIDDDQCDVEFTMDAITLLVNNLIESEDDSVIDLLKDLRKKAKRELS